MNTKPTQSEPLLSGDLFARCYEWVLFKDGRIECACKLGLWGVSGHDKATIEREARHYWAQYFGDGEYAELLANTKTTDAEATP